MKKGIERVRALNRSVVTVLWLLLSLTMAEAQSFNSILNNPTLSEKQRHFANVQIQEETTQGHWYIQLDPAVLRQQVSSLNFTMPNGDQILISELRYERTFGSTLSGSGKFYNGAGDFIFALHDGMVTARLGCDQFSYMIYPLTGDMHILLLLNTTVFPHDETDEGYRDMIEKGEERNGTKEEPRLDKETNTLISPEQVLAGDCKVRVLVAYTDDFAANIADPIGFAQSCIQANNTSFANSNVNFQVELACAYETSYAESGNSTTDKTAFRDISDGQMDEVSTWRTYYDADLCHLLVNNLSNGCGEAWNVSISVYADAFCVTDRGCAVGNLTFPHELGHLYGARHDVFVDATNTPYAYGHGKTVTGSYRTVMAYVDACGSSGCNRVAYFSNPAVTYLGVATGNSGTADNESAHEASRVAISGLETTLSLKSFPAFTHDDGEFGDVLATAEINNLTTYVMNSGSNVVWRAGSLHTLKPGFWAKAGSKFQTQFDNCTPLAIAAPDPARLADNVNSGTSFVQVMPNPFTNRFDALVKLEKDGFMDITLMDATGKQVMSIIQQRETPAGEYRFNVDVSQGAQGVYFLVVKTDEEVKTLRLIKND